MIYQEKKLGEQSCHSIVKYICQINRGLIKFFGKIFKDWQAQF